MRTFRFDKLVRDKIVSHQESQGCRVDYKILDDHEYLQALKAKLLEEAAELDTDNNDGLLGELADLQEVIDTLLEAINKTKDELAEAQAKKNAKNGAFSKRHFISVTTVPDDNSWIEYYLKNPSKYPEVKK